MVENNQVLIKKKYLSKHRVKSFILQETALKRTSNDILQMTYRKIVKIVGLNES